MQDDPDSDSSDGENVFDVYTKSAGTGLEIGVFFPVGICFGFTGRKVSWKMFATFLALVLTVSTISCGGGGNGVGGSGGGGGGTGGGGGGDNSNQGTPVGTYNGATVTVTINGVTQSINNISVNVQ